jgi:hypothetical protein
MYLIEICSSTKKNSQQSLKAPPFVNVSNAGDNRLRPIGKIRILSFGKRLRAELE